MSEEISLKKVIKAVYPQGRFKQIGLFKVDLVIRDVFAVLFIAWTIFSIWQAHPYVASDIDYYACETEDFGGCHNPFYRATDWRNREYLPPGEYGNPEAAHKVGYYIYGVIMLLIKAVLINMLFWNSNIFKGKKGVKRYETYYFDVQNREGKGSI